MTDYADMSLPELQAEENRILGGLREAGQIQAEFHRNLSEVRRLVAQKESSSKVQPKVSDHAVLRYIERTRGYDVEGVRQEILTDRVKDALRAGATGYEVNGVRFKARDGVLTTVLT